MRQLSLKMKMHIGNLGVINNNAEKFILNILLWSFGALAIWYVLILGNMVSDIIQRKNLESRARVLSNEVSDLELAYFSLSNNIDLNFSHSLGFKETNVKFATRKSLGSLGHIKISQNEI